MRALLLATVVVFAGIAAAAVPSLDYLLRCPSCQALIASATSPSGSFVVFGGNNGFALLDLAKANWSWSFDFPTYGSEQEGPFAWTSDKLIGGMAPDSSSTETLWAIDATNGNNTWNTNDDGSISGVTLTSAAGYFFSGSVTENSITAVDNTGKTAWKVALGDYIFQTSSASKAADGQVVLVAYGNSVACFGAHNGTLLWNVTGLPTQAATLAAHDDKQIVYLTGSADPDGNQLAYTTVYAFNYHQGGLVWSKNITNANLITNLQIRGERVFAYGNNTVTALDATTGVSVFTTELFTPPSNPVPAATPGRLNTTEVLFASVTGTDLTALNAQTGKPVWKLTLPQGLQASLSPVLLVNQLIVPVTTSDQNHGSVAVYSL